MTTYSASNDTVAHMEDADRNGRRYTRGAILFHWVTAALVISTIPIVWVGEKLGSETAQSAINLHKSIGILVLALTIGRLGWRIANAPPPLPASYSRQVRLAAGSIHVVFYVLLIVLPLSGWWMSSATPERHAFGLGPVHVPFLPVPRGMASAAPAHATHVNLGWVMAILVAVHVLAALRHHFVDRDRILDRMLVARDSGRSGD